ncbi:oligosaccharide flippase family protein [Cytobacillus suaedae]|nr:oligosaccharide flippase family protein [Cytobacillus suaedae]
MNRNRNRMSANVVANLFGRLWSMFSIYLFIPLYIYFLGEEAYGLVTFYATLYTVMNLLGLGLSKTLRREFASGEDNDEIRLKKYKMLRSVEVVYFGITFLIIIICFLGAEALAEHWLNIGSLDKQTVIVTIRLMGVTISLQILSYLYIGGLLGLEYQVKANMYLVGWSIAKNLGVIIVLWLIKEDIRLFYIWHIIVDLFFLMLVRISVIKLLEGNTPLKWSLADITNLKEIKEFAFGLFLVSLVYTLNSQLDKIVVSKLLSLLEVGAYFLTYSLGQLTSIISTAIATAAFSKLTMYFSTNDIKMQKESYINLNRIAGITVICIGTFVAVYAYELLLVWTGNQILSNIARSAAFYVVIGSTFAALQIISYEYLLSRGNTKINNVLGISSIPYTLIVTPILVSKFGIFGAAISWCILMTVLTIIYLSYIHYNYIGNDTIRWLIGYTFLPFIFSLGIAYLSKYITIIFGFSLIETLIFAVLSGGFVLIINFFLFDNIIINLIRTKISSLVFLK